MMGRCRWRLGAAVMLLVAAAGCTDVGGEGSAELATPEATPISYEQALRMIPLEGSPERPFYWEIAPQGDPDVDAAIIAVQYYESTSEWLLLQPYPRQLEHLAVLEWFGTPEFVEIDIDVLTGHYPNRSDRNVRMTGPRWIRLLAAELVKADEALVLMCYDKGWFTTEGLAGEPRQSGPYRYDLHSYYVVRDPELYGDDYWRVQHLIFNPDDDRWFPEGISQAEAEASCDQWAVHGPEDVP